MEHFKWDSVRLESLVSSDQCPKQNEIKILNKCFNDLELLLFFVRPKLFFQLKG